MDLRRLLRLVLLSAGAALALGVSAAERRAFFRPGDIWVLSGDSITFIDLYRQTVQDALDHFHPGHGIRVVNTGVWGQLAKEAAGKGLALKPTVVSILLGMNNVIHAEYDASTDFSRGAQAYVSQLRRQVRQYQSVGAAVVLMAPTLTDERENSYFGPSPHTRRGLVAYGEALRRLAVEERCFFIPTGEEFEAAKRTLKPMQNFITDGVHPYGWGQYEIARSLIHHLNVSAPFPAADEPRGFTADDLPVRDFAFAPASRFLAAKDAPPALTITAPRSGAARLVWSVEGADLRGERTLAFADAPLTVTLPVPAEGLPARPGCISRLLVSVTPEGSTSRLAVVDLARTVVHDMTKGVVRGEVRTAEARPEGPRVATWEVREDGPDLWFEGRVFASSFPARPKPPADTWMNSSGMNGVMMMLDLRPSGRFADNNFDRDMHMVCFSVLERPWAVLPLAWEGRRLANCLYGGAEPTADGYAWRIGVRGFLVDYQRFDVRTLDHFGANLIFNDADEAGTMGRYPTMPYPDLDVLTPERRLNQTMIFDRRGDVPQVGGETTNVGVYGI